MKITEVSCQEIEKIMLLVLDDVYFTSKNISDMKKDIFTETNVIFLKAHQLMGLE